MRATCPIEAGRFDLDDYIDTMRDMFRFLGGDVHVFAVCQPSVPVLAATALMEADGDPAVPLTLILAGGPIDTRIGQTAVNTMAEKRGTDWFRRNVTTNVPWPCPGRGRQVYPGFLQLSGFMTMNLDRHMQAQKDMFVHLVQATATRPTSTANSMTNTWPSWTSPPSSTCRRSTRCSCST